MNFPWDQYSNRQTKHSDNIFISIYLDSVIIIAAAWLVKPSGIDLWNVDPQTPQFRSTPEQKTPVRGALCLLELSPVREDHQSDRNLRLSEVRKQRIDLEVSQKLHNFDCRWSMVDQNWWMNHFLSTLASTICLVLGVFSHLFVRIHRALINHWSTSLK